MYHKIRPENGLFGKILRTHLQEFLLGKAQYWELNTHNHHPSEQAFEKYFYI